MQAFLTRCASLLPASTEAVSAVRLAELAASHGIPAPERFQRGPAGPESVPMETQIVQWAAGRPVIDLGACTALVEPRRGRHWPLLVRFEPNF